MDNHPAGSKVQWTDSSKRHVFRVVIFPAFILRRKNCPSHVFDKIVKYMTLGVGCDLRKNCRVTKALLRRALVVC